MEHPETGPSKDRPTVEVTADRSQAHQTLEEYERLFGVDEDAYEQPTTTRKELWSYYLYYNGATYFYASMLGCLKQLTLDYCRRQRRRSRVLQPSPVRAPASSAEAFGPAELTLDRFQWALNGAGHQPDTDPPKPCTESSSCVVPWAGGTRSTSSVILIANGLCFTFMTVIFVWLGSAADYGSFGRWLLLALTIVAWALQYGMLAIRDPSQWPAAMGMYVVAYIAYGATLVFYAAVFPRLARYMPHVRKARDELRERKIDQQEYDAIESLERNHIRYD